MAIAFKETRFDSKPINLEQDLHIKQIKSKSEELAILIDGIEMDLRQKAIANSHLEDCVMHAVKGISHKKK